MHIIFIYSLIKFYVSPERLSDNDTLEVLNSQIASARTVTDFDLLEKSLNELIDWINFAFG